MINNRGSLIIFDHVELKGKLVRLLRAIWYLEKICLHRDSCSEDDGDDVEAVCMSQRRARVREDHYFN